MRHILTLVLLSFTFLLVSNNGFGQTKIKIAKRNYVIPPFKNDSVVSKAKAELGVNYTGVASGILNYRHFKNGDMDIFEKLGILKPIQNSAYDLEVRLYLPSEDFYEAAFVLKGNSKELLADYYFYKLAPGSPKNGEVFKTRRIGNVLYGYTEKMLTVPDTLLSSLIKNKLFNYDPVAIT